MNVLPLYYDGLLFQFSGDRLVVTLTHLSSVLHDGYETYLTSLLCLAAASGHSSGPASCPDCRGYRGVSCSWSSCSGYSLQLVCRASDDAAMTKYCLRSCYSPILWATFVFSSQLHKLRFCSLCFLSLIYLEAFYQGHLLAFEDIGYPGLA